MIKRLFTLLALTVCIASLPSIAHAATFNAGRIIDDSVFTDTTTMSASDIQNFLNSKVPTCDTNGTQSAADWGYPNLTHAQFATQIKGWPGPPYTCLKDYSENGVTAAQLIYNLAQQYKINPQALIVTLQKESSLVTDTWPLSTQYRTATGYGCPDSGPNNSANCNANYYGFTNQMDWTATMYRAVLNQSPTWYSPYVKGSNYIQWSPTASCGGSVVNVENWSTAALYDYTPYQPNSAALSAGYGMGDACSAYGNRNFFLYFTNWFSSTYAPSYSWQFQGQYAYTDSTKTTPANLSTLRPGQRVYVGFKAKNTGNQTWTNTGNSPIRVGTVRPYNRASSFYDSSWISYGRPGNLKESSVAPGEVGTFEFWMTAPNVSSGSDFSEYFAPLAEGVTWMQDYGMYFGLHVSPPNYTWQIANQVTYTDSSKTIVSNLDNLNPQEKRFVSLIVKNTGDITWTNTGPNAVYLGTTGPLNRASPFADATWPKPYRPALMKEASVAPGQNATFEFWMSAPSVTSATDFVESFNLVSEGAAWMKDIGYNYRIHVNPAVYSWQLMGQAAFTDDSMTTVTGLDQMYPEQRKYIFLVIKNTGNVVWRNSGDNPMDLGTTHSTDRLSQFFDDTWVGQSRPARMREASVAPGQTASFGFWMKSPVLSNDTDYLEYFTPVVEGITWLQDIGLNYRIHAIAARYTWSLDSLYAYSDSTKTNPIGLGGLKPGQRAYIGLTAKNTGTVTWLNSGNYPVRIGTSRPNDHLSPLCDSSWISCTRPVVVKESSVAPGQTGTFEFWITAPNTLGVSKEYFNLLNERRAWFNDIGLNYAYSVQ